MDYYLNRRTETGSALFDVFGTTGICLHTAEGKQDLFRGKLYLHDATGAGVAKISCMGIHGLCKHSVQIEKKERMRATYNLVPSGSSPRLNKADQSLRGDLFTRGSDAVDGRGNVRTTHVPCWTVYSDGYEIHVEQQQDVPLSLYFVVIVGNAALCGPGCAVPTN